MTTMETAPAIVPQFDEETGRKLAITVRCMLTPPWRAVRTVPGG